MRNTTYALLIIIAWGASAMAGGMRAAPASLARAHAPVGLQADGRVIVPTNQVLSPAGFQVTFPGWPTDLALSPDGRLLAVLNSSGLVLIRVEDRAIMQTLPLARDGNSFTGIAWTPDGTAVTRGEYRARSSAAWRHSAPPSTARAPVAAIPPRAASR